MTPAKREGVSKTVNSHCSVNYGGFFILSGIDSDLLKSSKCQIIEFLKK